MTQSLSSDSLAQLLKHSQQHRRDHGCGAYPYDKGPLLAVLAAAIAPRHIVEVGTALGYTALCMAEAAPLAQIDTVDIDKEHIDLAIAHFASYGVADRISAHWGDADDVLPSLSAGTYDMAFFDGFAPTRSLLNKLNTLLRSGGTLICANLTLGGDREKILKNTKVWRSYSLGETAIAVKQ